MQSVKHVSNVKRVSNVERVVNNPGEGNGREFEGTKWKGNLLLKEAVKVDLHKSNDENLFRGSYANDPSNIAFTKKNLNLLFYAEEERNSLGNVDRGDGNSPTSSDQENCPQSCHNNVLSAQCTDSNGNAVSADNGEEGVGNFIHVGIGARFREDDHVSDQCESDGVVRKTEWSCGIRGVSSNQIIDQISDKTCDNAIDLSNRSDNTCNGDDIVRDNSANSGCDNVDVEQGEATNGSTHERNRQDDVSSKTNARDEVKGSGMHDLEGKNTRNIIKVMYTERVEKCDRAESTKNGESPKLKKEKISVNGNFDEEKKQNGVVKWVNFNHDFDKSPTFNEKMEELKFLKEIYEREKVDRGKGSDAEVNPNFKVTTISGNQKLPVRRNANLNFHYGKNTNFNREDKVKTFTSALSHLIKNNMEERQKGGDNPFGTLTPTGCTSYEPISAIPSSFSEEQKVNKINITYSHHQDGNNVDGPMEGRSITKGNCGEGVITSECASDKGKESQYMSCTEHDVANSDYSFNGKINLSEGGANGEEINMPRKCQEKVTFAEGNPLFEDSKVTYVEPSPVSRKGISIQNNFVLHKNGCERLNPGSIHYSRRKEVHSVWSGRNLSKGKNKSNKELPLKGSIKGSICENDGKRVGRRNTPEKRDKYSIHVSDYFSNQNDDYTSYMMSAEGAQNRLASDDPVVVPPCNDAKCNDDRYTSRGSNDPKMLRHVENQFARWEEAPVGHEHIKEDILAIDEPSGKPPQLGKINKDVTFRCTVQSSLNRESTEGESIIGEKALNRGTNNQHCNSTLFCCPVKEVTNAPPKCSRTTTLMNKLFGKGKKSPEHVDKREKDFKCVDEVAKDNLEETKRNSLLGKCSISFKKDKADLFELPTGEKRGRTFSYVSNGANGSRRLCTNCPTIPCEPFKRGGRTGTQLYKAPINLPTYADRRTSIRRNTTTMNNASPTAVPYPKCELICKIPRRAFTSYFQGRDC
ncbi:Uncharacterized protein PCOAH_00043900 [Plasmodium coatneyi]|uniref:Uncharacterized protein n=1 Tax=Plasmodium coatneyi TaxID=208452 RepID=A0A1B1E5F5_9APIC|nr:Uncharacterized protein PCOAH_00043900 [Plasmodium coatneyi]ANQ10253.1 Uncharacterized protein PCOAH_00043900 [Plasmodium coatneyi]